MVDHNINPLQALNCPSISLNDRKFLDGDSFADEVDRALCQMKPWKPFPLLSPGLILFFSLLRALLSQSYGMARELITSYLKGD